MHFARQVLTQQVKAATFRVAHTARHRPTSLLHLPCSHLLHHQILPNCCFHFLLIHNLIGGCPLGLAAIEGGMKMACAPDLLADFNRAPLFLIRCRFCCLWACTESDQDPSLHYSRQVIVQLEGCQTNYESGFVWVSWHPLWFNQSCRRPKPWATNAVVDSRRHPVFLHHFSCFLLNFHCHHIHCQGQERCHWQR